MERKEPSRRGPGPGPAARTDPSGRTGLGWAGPGRPKTAPETRSSVAAHAGAALNSGYLLPARRADRSLGPSASKWVSTRASGTLAD